MKPYNEQKDKYESRLRYLQSLQISNWSAHRLKEMKEISDKIDELDLGADASTKETWEK